MAVLGCGLTKSARKEVNSSHLSSIVRSLLWTPHVAKFGSAPDSWSGGRWFKSSHPDHFH